MSPEEERDKIRFEFEQWVRRERNQSVERYQMFPHSYLFSEVGAMWEAWLAASLYKRCN